MKYLKILVPYTVLGFLLNFFWESWHGIHLYHGGENYAGQITNYVYINTIASVLDAVSLLLIFICIAIISTGVDWWKNISWKNISFLDVSVFAILSVGGAFAVEWYATKIVGWWSYNDLMPTILGIGLSPLVQILVTGMLTIAIMRLATHGS
jgi:hypothetical protein